MFWDGHFPIADNYLVRILNIHPLKYVIDLWTHSYDSQLKSLILGLDSVYGAEETFYHGGYIITKLLLHPGECWDSIYKFGTYHGHFAEYKWHLGIGDLIFCSFFSVYISWRGRWKEGPIWL